MTKAMLTLAVLAVLCAMAGCAGNETTGSATPPSALHAQSAPGRPLTLPAPVAVEAAAKQAAAGLVLEHQGGEYLDGCVQNAELSLTSLEFQPAWASDAQSFDNAAFAIYSFNLQGYSGDPYLDFAWWWNAEAKYEDLWIGLSNRASNRWDWFQIDASQVLDLGANGFSPYIRLGTGDLFVAVVMLGTEPTELDRLGLINRLTYTASGYVLDQGEIGFAGVTLTFSGGLESVVTDASGFWMRDGIHDGVYTVTPSLTDYNFAPYAQEFEIQATDAILDDFVECLPGPGDWSCFGHDRRRTKLSKHIGPQTADLAWTFNDSLNESSCSPAIGVDGMIYIGGIDGRLYAVDPTGAVRWSYLTEAPIESSPAIGADGTVYFGSDDNNLYAINPDGTPQWSYLTAGPVHSSPAIGEDGTIIVGSDDYSIYAILPDGNKSWSYELPAIIRSSPAIADNGTIYIGCSDGKLYSFSSHGVPGWDYAMTGEIVASPAVDAEGVVYICDVNGYLDAINQDGTQHWRYNAGSAMISSPALGADGTVYIGTVDNEVVAINADGSHKWSYPSDISFSASPALGADGTVYIADEYGLVMALNDTGTLKWSYNTSAAITSCAAIGSNGSVYFSSITGLWAFGK